MLGLAVYAMGASVSQEQVCAFVDEAKSSVRESSVMRMLGESNFCNTPGAFSTLNER